MRFRKPRERSWEPPAPQCVLIVRCREVPSDLESPEGWRTQQFPAASGDAPPGARSDEANERYAAASVELLLELRHDTGPVGPVVQSGMAYADSLATRLGGVIVDPFAQRLVMPGEWQVEDKVYDIDPREHVSVQIVAERSGLWVHTHGLVKFGRPELELFDIPADLESAAYALVLDTAAYVIDGPVIAPGNTLGPALGAFEGTREAEHWDGVPVVELRGVGASTAEALRAGAA